ncbi:MAG: carboxymuconolactone decarboxylase family protein [Gammaproteobacteria bacterium]
MTSFDVHTLDTAPPDSKPLLQHSKTLYGGMIPNLHGVMAESPALLAAYQKLNEVSQKMTLDLVETNIVWLAINFENGCDYCMAAHTAIAKHAGVEDQDIDALRNNQPLSNPKHETLRQFTVQMLEARGWVDDATIDALLAAGYSRSTVLDVILCIGMKTLSNYTNHIAHTPVDKAFTKFAWQKPK